MTVSLTSDNIQQYDGNGSSQLFPVSFDYDVDNDVEVYLTDKTTGITTQLTAGVDYTVTSGNVSTTLTYTTNDRLTIAHRQNIVQLTSYPPNGEFPASAHEDALDDIIKQVKALNAKVERCLQVPIGELLSFDPDLGSFVSRANKTVGFDANGDLDLYVADTTSAAQAAAAAATAQAAAATIDGFEWKGQWTTSTSYVVNNLVEEGGSTYICLVDHTSGTFSTDLSASRWELFASEGATGAGTGDLLASNNLSDVSNAATSRSNIGAAASGANSDITAITGLTTDLAIAHGGTGASTAAAARTNLGLGTASTVNIGLNTIWVPAQAIRPTVANGCSPLASIATSSGRPDLNHLAFSESADQHGQFTVAFPKRWNAGTISFQPIWTGLTSDSGTVSWKLQAVACADNDTADVAYGTAQSSLDTFLGTAEDVHVGPISSAITIAGSPGDDELVFFRIFRDVSEDSRAAPANLLGIKLYYTIDELRDD